MSKPKTLLQLDTDLHPSSFDSIVAIDSDVDHLLRFGQVSRDNVESLVHGAIFTRGPSDLKATAIFIGGSQVEAVEVVTDRVLNAFFGPIQVSVMADPNGSNTTAAAAVLAATKHLSLQDRNIVILGGSGPVGQRIGQMIGMEWASQNQVGKLTICSRKIERAEKVCDILKSRCQIDCFVPFAAMDLADNQKMVQQADIVFAAGAAGVPLLPDGWLSDVPKLSIAIDLNAVPPLGLPGIKSTDQNESKNGVICYGAIGVGGIKMKIHKACIRQLFETNKGKLLTQEIYQIAKSLLM